MIDIIRNRIELVPSHYKLVAYIISAALALAAAGATGWTVKGWQAGAEIASLKAEHAKDRETQATAALTTLKADADAITKAASEYAAIVSPLAPKIAALTKELRNAPKLPPDCRPTADRVQILDAAIDAANQSIPR